MKSMVGFGLLFLLCLSCEAGAQSDLQVNLGPHSVEVEADSGFAGLAPPQSESLPGRHLHYRMGLCPIFPVQVLTPRRWLPVGGGPYRLHIRCQPGVNYVTSLPPGEGQGLVVDEAQLGEHPLFAFGKLAVHQHQFPGGVLTQAYVPGALKLRDARLSAWVERTGQGVADFFGRFPVERAVLLITPVDSGSIQGVTFGQGGPNMRVRIPRDLSEAEVAGSWQLCHEMVHLAVPDTEQHWLEEGLATYVEPLIRLHIGDIKAERVWADLLEGLPKGVGEVQRAGLDGNRSWGATYWGGALFCLLADVRLRAESHNQHTLQEALRAVVARANITQAWTLTDFLERADLAVGSQVLEQVHEQLESRQPLDLQPVWAQLGIVGGPGEPEFEVAPLDFVRRAIAPEP